MTQDRDIGGACFVGGLFVLLLGLAWLLPHNGVTGRVIEQPCSRGECLLLCDTDAVCGEGRVCCATTWESGICDIAARCGTVLEYSHTQTIDQYRETIQDPPPAVDPGWWLILPLLACAVVISAVAMRRVPGR